MIRPLLAAGTLLAAVLLGVAADAGAHEGDGQLALQAVEPATPTAPGPVRYRVLLTYLNDGHPAPDATVTAVAEQGGTTAVGPVVMAPGTGEGIYEATLQLPAPGAWTVRFTSVTPGAVLERSEQVGAASTSTSPTTAPPVPPPPTGPATTATTPTTPTTPTTGPATTATTPGPVSTAPATSTTTDAGSTVAPTGTGTVTSTGGPTSGDDDGVGPWWVVIAVLGAAVLAGAAVALVRARRARDHDQMPGT